MKFSSLVLIFSLVILDLADGAFLTTVGSLQNHGLQWKTAHHISPMTTRLWGSMEGSNDILPPVRDKKRYLASSSKGKSKKKSRKRNKTQKWKNSRRGVKGNGSSNNSKNFPKSSTDISDLLSEMTIDDFKGEIPDTRQRKTKNSRKSFLKGKVKGSRNYNNKNARSAKKKYSQSSSYLDSAMPERSNVGRSNDTAARGSRFPQQRRQQKVPNGPWEAPFHISSKTQHMLQSTFRHLSSGHNKKPPHIQAEGVLTALLETPAELSNEANVICALTLSAKCMKPSTQITPSFKNKLFEVFGILQNEFLAKDKLNSRQLCNAIYAIAKHYNRDESLLPAAPLPTAMSEDVDNVNMGGGGSVSFAEAWILEDEDIDNSREKALEQTVEMIAEKLTSILLQQDGDNGGITVKHPPKVGEVSMASWAYGVLKQRSRPPGWEVPPQLSRVPQNKRSTQQQNANNNVQRITFEQWATTDDHDDDVVFNNGNDVSCHLDAIGSLFDAIGEYLCQETKDGGLVLEQCSWSEIANLVWAYANHGHCRTEASETLMISVTNEARWRLDNSKKNGSFVKPRDVAQLSWSIGTLQSDNFRLGEDMLMMIESIADYWLDDDYYPLRDWSNTDLLQMAISLAHGRIDQQDLLKAVYRETLERLLEDLQNERRQQQSFRSWEVSVLLWVQARLYLPGSDSDSSPDPVFSAFLREAPRWLNEKAKGSVSLQEIGVGAQEQANLAWSLSVLEEYENPESRKLLKRIFHEASLACRQNEFIQVEHAHQLWQALYLMEFECPEIVADVPKWFRDFLKDRWTAEKARRKTSSARHRSLSQTLSLMGVSHINEHEEDIDVAIVLKENARWTHERALPSAGAAAAKNYKVAVEFDGPNHFTRERVDKETGNKILPRTLGHTVLKYRLLKRQGWAVVRVPYFEFDKIPFWASMERQRYLQRLLKTHANLKFSQVDVSEYSSIPHNRETRFD